MIFFQTAERTSALASSENFNYRRSLFAYKEAKKYIHGDVLELGCGEGYAVNEMSKKVSRYIAVDKYNCSLESILLEDNVEFIKMKFPPLKYIAFNSYDFVICFQTIEHIKEDEVFLKDIYRVLKPGGKLILTTPNRLMSLSRNPYHIREYNKQTMKELIKSSFQKFSISGIHGDAMVAEYYERNRKSISDFKKYDILDLENRLSAPLWKIPYNILNRMNKRSLAAKNNFIHTEANFLINEDLDACLDFFVMAEK